MMKRIEWFFKGFSKKLIVMLIVCLLMGIIQVSTGYREEIIKQEQEMFYDKGNPSIKYYQEVAVKQDFSTNGAVYDMFDCYQENVDFDNINGEVKMYIDVLNQLYGESGRYFSFLYQDLFSGFTVSYNEDAPIFTASTIKAPAMIYLYELASRGEIDLNEKLTYTSNFYSGGSGVLKTKKVGTSYSVEELIWYSIHDSDNIAYAMLMNRFKRENVLSFWNGLGTKNIYTLNTIWGVTSARDAYIYMRELYRFSQENKDYGTKLLEYFKQAEWKLITDREGNFNTANKGGWSGEAIHDVAIVFDKNPYILVIMSKMGESNYSYLFKETSEIVGKMHRDYWKQKVETCNNITLY